MEFEEITPKSYPTLLLNKDWSKRKCYTDKGESVLIAKIHEMEVRHDDVWVVTLPKCGTTWMQELVWLVMNNFNFDAAKSEHLELRSPFLEFDFEISDNLELALKRITELKSPRLIKSHLPLPLLPAQLWSKKPKVIYVFRNPKDVLVSEFYHGRSLGFDMNITLDESVSNYIDNSSSMILPFEHVTEFYALRHESWLYYTSFERMKMNLQEIIKDICTFLNTTLPNWEQMQQTLKHLSFEEMKHNPTTNHQWEFEQYHKKFNQPHEHHNFVRKGKVGGYRDELSNEIIIKCDNWIEQQLAAYNLTMNQLLLLNNE